MSELTCPTLDKTLSASLHIFILFAVLCLLFIFIVSKLEMNAFNDEIKTLMTNKVLPDLKAHGSAQLKHDLNFINFDALKSYYSGPNQALSINNKWIKTVMIIVNAFLFLFIVTISLLGRKCLSFRYILLENAIVFLLIGIFEYMFFKRVASKYIPVLPSTFQQTLFTNLWK